MKHDSAKENTEREESAGNNSPVQNDSDKENNAESSQKELQDLKISIQEKEKENGELLDRLQRIAAEFDNYKKRSIKEKEMIYSHAMSEIIKGILPIIDNMEKAFETCNKDDADKVIEGIVMIQKQFKDLLKDYGITEIEALNKKFDPELHEAVAHICDDGKEENIIVEELRKGYKRGEQVIRHSMVKVAN